MAEKGLGTGLGALFGDAALEADSVDCVFLPISKVETGLLQPRKEFSDESLEELAESISQNGIIQPLTVRKLATGNYQIIAGERRWRAARIAGLSRVPARIVEADDRSAMIIALVENLQREDLNAVEEAEGYRCLMEEYGLTQEKCAEHVGKSRPAVANATRLLTLPEKVLEMVRKGLISAGHARALLPLPKELQIKTAKQIIDMGLSVRQTETEVKRLLSADKRKPRTLSDEQKLASIYARDLEQRLASELGRRVRITEGLKKGRIELEYYGNEDLDTIIAALRKITGGGKTNDRH
ncbi:MAG: ParB/RepB/Spo0J family partition protein [Clostridiales bacterium]|nr:ParB/RepB/Spo0J family partition protein [Clostridiales bacterium]